jgi:hypothetical protein
LPISFTPRGQVSSALCCSPPTANFAEVLSGVSGPFHDKAQRTVRDMPFKNAQRAYLNGDMVFAVPCVEMGWAMIIVEHCDYDSIKPAYLRHSINIILQIECIFMWRIEARP